MYIRQKYRQIPYVIVSAFFLIGCGATGMVVVGGAHYIKDAAYEQGQYDMLTKLPLEALVHLKVTDDMDKDYDI